MDPSTMPPGAEVAKLVPIPDAVVDAACAAYLAEIEGVVQSEATRLWHDWRLHPAGQGDAVAISALEEDRRAMRAALGAAFAKAAINQKQADANV